MDIPRDDMLMMLYKQLGILKKGVKLVADDVFEEFSNTDDEEYAFEVLNVEYGYLCDVDELLEGAMRNIEKAARS